MADRNHRGGYRGRALVGDMGDELYIQGLNTVFCDTSGEIVFCWYFGYAISSNLTSYTHGQPFHGDGGCVTLNNTTDCFNLCGMCKHVEQVVLCLLFLLIFIFQ